MSDKNVEQQINIKFCVKIGKNASKTLALLTLAYGEYAIKKSSVTEWYRLFKEGQEEDMQADSRSVQPKTHRIDAPRLKISYETNSRKTEYVNLFGGERPEL
jgi:hypothetical protein